MKKYYLLEIENLELLEDDGYDSYGIYAVDIENYKKAYIDFDLDIIAFIDNEDYVIDILNIDMVSENVYELEMEV